MTRFACLNKIGAVHLCAVKFVHCSILAPLVQIAYFALWIFMKYVDEISQTRDLQAGRCNLSKNLDMIICCSSHTYSCISSL